MKDQIHLKSLINSYQQKIFALALYLSGNNKDKAYDITTSSFVKILSTTSFFEEGDSFLARVAGVVVEKSRDIKVVPSLDESNLPNISPGRRKFFQLIKLALQSLPFETKVLLLLRDQVHLAYKDISAILQIPESSLRIQAPKAREQLQEKIKEILSSAR